MSDNTKNNYNVFTRNCFTCSHRYEDFCTGYGTRKDDQGYTYNMPIEESSKMFPDGCEDWGFSISAITGGK